YNDGRSPNCGNWVVGIDSVTGAQKFSIPIGGGRAVRFLPNGLIVAGDGYAYGLYLASESFASPQVFVAHLMILRVATDGTYSNMELKSWTNRNGTRSYSGGLISNGDQGVVVTWDVVEVGSDPYNYALDTHNLGMALASGSGATVVNDNGPLVSGQNF